MSYSEQNQPRFTLDIELLKELLTVVINRSAADVHFVIHYAMNNPFHVEVEFTL